MRALSDHNFSQRFLIVLFSANFIAFKCLPSTGVVIRFQPVL
jgi:hypothetical protein